MSIISSSIDSTKIMNKKELVENFNYFNDNIVRQLFVISRDTHLRLREALLERGYKGLTLSFAIPLMILSYRPERVTDLAEKLSMSKQLCVQTLLPIENAGFIARQTDPTDGRAKLVKLTKKGEKLIDEAVDQLKNIVMLYTKKVGNRRIQQMSSIFQALSQAQAISSLFTFPELFADATGEASNILVPALCGRFSKYLEKRLIDMVRALGHPGLSPSYLQVLFYLSPSSSNMNDIAATNGVTVQAVNRIANELEELGYIVKTRSAAAASKRDLKITGNGFTLIKDLAESIKHIESELVGLVGAESTYATFTQNCQQLFNQIGREGDFVKIYDKIDFDDNLLKGIEDIPKIDLGIEEIMLFFAASFEQSRHRTQQSLRLTKSISEKDARLISFSDSAKRALTNTMIDIDLAGEEVQKRLGKERSKSFMRQLTVLFSKLDV